MASVSLSGYKCYVGGAAHCSYRTSGTPAYLGYNASGVWGISVKFSASVSSGEKITSIGMGLCFYGVSRNVYAIVSSSDNNSTYAGASGSKSGATFIEMSGGGNSGTWSYFNVSCNITSSGTYYVYFWPADTSSQSLLELYNGSSSPYQSMSVAESAKQVTVTFAKGSGSGSVPSSITGYSGDYVSISSTTPTPPANSAATTYNFTITAYNGSTVFGTHTASKKVYNRYSFSHWSGSGYTAYAGGGMYLPSSSITLTAQYSSTQVTEYLNNTIADIMNSVGTPSKTYSDVNIPVLLDAATNGGTCAQSYINAKQSGTYTFVGWNTSSNQSTGLSTSTKFTVADDVYAIYSLSTYINAVNLPTTGVSKPSTNIAGYTITLNPGSGTVSPTSIVAGRVRKYTFLGWSTSPNGTSYITSYTPTNSNEVVYAVFDSGTEVNEPATLPAAVRANYAFLGWSTTSGGTTYVDTIYMPTSNITLYANYKASKEVEMYIYSSGAWRKAHGYLHTSNVFNQCVSN